MKYQYLTEVSVIRQKLSEPDSLESYLKEILIDQNVTGQKRQDAVNLLVNEGWNRRSFYDLGIYLVNDDLSERQQDLIIEFLDDLSEFRSLANLVMVEIAGETPKEKADFMNFLYRFD